MPRINAKPKTPVTVEFSDEEITEIRIKADRYHFTVPQWLRIVAIYEAKK